MVLVYTIMFALSMIFNDFDEDILARMYRAKMERANLDLKRHLLEHGNDFTTEEQTFEICLKACYWKDTPNAETRTFIKDVVLSLLTVAVAICVGVFFSQAAESAMKMFIVNNKIDYKSLNYTPLIVGAVILVVDFVVMVINSVCFSKGYDKYKEDYLKKVENNNQQ